jgi:hypothetical protein
MISSLFSTFTIAFRWLFKKTMGNFFACTWLVGDDVAKPNKYEEAVWDLKLQRDKLQQYKKKVFRKKSKQTFKVEAIMEREKKMAKELLRKNQKEQAKLILQKVSPSFINSKEKISRVSIRKNSNSIR